MDDQQQQQQQHPGQAVRSYRIYFLDSADHIAKAVDVEAVSDEEVSELAAKMLAEESKFSKIEVWDRARRVYSSVQDMPERLRP